MANVWWRGGLEIHECDRENTTIHTALRLFICMLIQYDTHSSLTMKDANDRQGHSLGQDCHCIFSFGRERRRLYRMHVDKGGWWNLPICELGNSRACGRPCCSWVNQIDVFFLKRHGNVIALTSVFLYQYLQSCSTVQRMHERVRNLKYNMHVVRVVWSEITDSLTKKIPPLCIKNSDDILRNLTYYSSGTSLIAYQLIKKWM